MSWLARKTIDLVSAVTQFYYSRKYRALARHLGRPAADDKPTSPGLIIIQIDGLSYASLQEALGQGYMPHLRRALDEEPLHLGRWRCGLPSTTPAVQAGIMYGYNFDIPGFRWYEKETGVSMVCKRPDQLGALAALLSRNGRGLLRGGSSYTNLFDGDASLAIFTVSKFGSAFFDNVRGIGFASLFLLSPGRVLRVIVRFVREYARDLARRAWALFKPGANPPIGWPSPVLHIAVDVVVAEIQTFGVMLDIYRGVPVIYATYSSYDDVAHHYGPNHPEALRALRQIDTHIYHINRMRKQYQRCSYDLYILSDHGMSAATPFKAHFGQTLGQFILKSIGEPLVLDELAGTDKPSTVKAHYLVEELRTLETRLPVRSAAFMRLARQALERRTPTDPEFMALDIQQRGNIAVRPSGDLAHVYFNIAPRRLNLSEITLLYPTLLNRLMEHPGIGLIVGRESGERESNESETIIIGHTGTLSCSNGQVKAEGTNPLASLSNPEAAARDLIRLDSFPHSGDLILLGTWYNDGHVISFEHQGGTHGGLGGPQEEPFLITPIEDGLSNSPPSGPVELHAHLAQKYLIPNL